MAPAPASASAERGELVTNPGGPLEVQFGGGLHHVGLQLLGQFGLLPAALVALPHHLEGLGA